MALITIKPTAADKFIANSIAAHTRPPVEKMAQLLTWGADEKLLLTLAAQDGCMRRGVLHCNLTPTTSSASRCSPLSYLMS
jgi:hypothetical protein